MNPIFTTDDIERQLAAMRSVLQQDVRGLANQARTLVDWRHHFGAHPWLYCGGAAALGFILVSSRQRPHKVETAVVAETNDDQEVVSRPRETARAEPTLLKTVLTLAATVVVRESLGYLMHRVRRDA